MVWKMFEKRGKSALAKMKVFRLFRSIGTLRNEDSHVSSPNQAFLAAPHEVDWERKRAVQYWHELRKAEALLHWQRLQNKPT